MSGLQYAASNTKIVTLISRPRLLTSISWSPDNNTFVYDSENRVYIYDIGAKTQRLLAEGSAPAWSPNGLWIAYRSPDGKAVTINPRTSETKVLLGGRKIEWGIHWSPDSRYVMVAEMKNYALDILHNPFDDRTRKMVIYRLEDGAKLSGEWFPGPGIADRGYYWVKDHRAFLKGASSHPTISPCNGY